jgi:murein DD-endopeptidase MepM/ murein hydrolase activator NlpD
VGVIEMIFDGTRYVCDLAPLVDADAWAFPVGEQAYPPERWYAATFHDLTGALNNGYKHTGIDLNLDVSPWGDIERTLGLSVYALTVGVVEYVTTAWSGVPMLVIRHAHDGAPLWVRYAHIVPAVKLGDSVKAGTKIGPFANYTQGAGGDHLHLDMALDQFAREWLDPAIRWVDPVPVLKAHLDPARVDAMLKKGG